MSAMSYVDSSEKDKIVIMPEKDTQVFEVSEVSSNQVVDVDDAKDDAGIKTMTAQTTQISPTNQQSAVAEKKPTTNIPLILGLGLIGWVLLRRK